MTKKQKMGPYILGLDLGVASVGWAVIPYNTEEISDDNLKMGVRIFDAGFKNEKGKEVSRSVERRMARGQRRNIWRRRRRLTKLFNILVKSGLLPDWNCKTPKQRQNLINRIDEQYTRSERYFPNGLEHLTQQTALYRVRAIALDEKVGLHSIGRIMYQFGKRRGFLSNSKMQSNSAEEKTGDVYTGIETLRDQIKAGGCRTLGEYFSTLNPEEERIRCRWVGRQQYIDEFNAIWDAQAQFHPDILTPRLRKKIYQALFAQRPLKSQKGLVARCELERGKRCAYKADPVFQVFRYWQKILDMTVYDPEVGDRPLTVEEQDRVADLLERADNVSFSAIRKALGFKRPTLKKENIPDDLPEEEKERLREKVKREQEEIKRQWSFNLEFREEKSLPGNRTRTRIRKVLEEVGVERDVAMIDQYAFEIITFSNKEALVKRLGKVDPELSEEVRKKLANVPLEPDYARISQKAARRLTEAMLEIHDGARSPLNTVKKILYEDVFRKREGKIPEYLEPVKKVFGDLRNPAVMRTLTEMRKVVNAIIREWGRPELIRVELARELTLSRKGREQIANAQDKRKKMNEHDKEELKRELAKHNIMVDDPTPRDILKYRLAKECNFLCPYTGKKISLPALFGDAPQFDIEHIVPFSRSLDDSFTNKTLCWAPTNRHVKKNMTPWECFGQTVIPGEDGTENDRNRPWTEMVKLVARFTGPYAKRKLELFKSQSVGDVSDERSSSLLNDTRYISTLALKYLASLYGGTNGVDPNRRLRIQVGTGKMTAELRVQWNLNKILYDINDPELNGTPRKNRDDHRHHAIDALVIALTTSQAIRDLSRASQRADGFDPIELMGSNADLETWSNRPKLVASRRLFAKGDVPPPVSGFIYYVERAVKNIVVSRRVKRKLSGPLHKETFHGDTPDPDGKSRASRESVFKLTKSKIDNIIDPEVRKAVASKFEEYGKIVRDNVDTHPFLTDSTGERKIPIRKVRIWTTVKSAKIGGSSEEKADGKKPKVKKQRNREPRARHVELRNNHHIAIYAGRDKHGNEKWEAKVVSLYEALQRVRQGKPIVDRCQSNFLFSLSKGEIVLRKDPIDGIKRYFVVEGFSEYSTGRIEIALRYLHDAHKGKEEDKIKGRERLPVSGLQKSETVKVRIDPLGRVAEAYD